MKKKVVLSVIAAAMVLSNSLTAFAAPELLEVDGQTMLFDSEYYAENNTDVTEVYGTDKDALARHYATAGISEGRLPYAPGTDVSAYRPVQEKKVLKKTETYNKDGILTEESFYDAQGNPTRTAWYNEDGLMEESFYDAQGNLIRKSMLDGSESEEYAYDDAGNQISEIRRAPQYFSEKIWRYDSYGNITFEASRNSPEGEMTGRRYEYEYDSQGRKIKKTECDGYSDKVWSEKEYSYETRGDMNIVTETKYMYKFISGSRYRCFDGIEEYVYDNNGNEIKYAWLTASKHKPGVDKSVLRQAMYREHVYDSQGNLIREDFYLIPLFDIYSSDGSQTPLFAPPYAYDLDDKILVPASGDDCVLINHSTEYNYDSWGNLIRATSIQYDGNGGDVLARNMNQVTEYNYDSQGNRTMEINYYNGEKTYYTIYIYE